MDFGADFKTKLKSVTAITDLVGVTTQARIYPDVLKINSSLPAITYSEHTGGESYEKLSGPLGVAETLMVVDCYAATRAAANALAEVVRVALQGPVNATWGDSYVSSVTCVTHRMTDVDWAADKQSIKRWFTRRAYRIFHEEANS